MTRFWLGFPSAFGLAAACLAAIVLGRPGASGIAAAEPPQGELLANALRGPLADVQDVVFAVRAPGHDGHWYANFGYWDSDPTEMMYGTGGGRLCRLALRTGRVTDLLNDPSGGVRDPQVDYGGKKILFSYRKGGSKFYHLYEINADGSGLRQLTGGPYDDIEPTYLPDGDILFCSSRCKRWVPCYNTQVAILYRCDADGKKIRQISGNVEHDNTPAVLPDGRILYMRWEYVDRSELCFHHLWTMNPDGTGQMIYYGNTHPTTAMLDARPIPGTKKVVSIFSPGHGRKEHAGRVTIVDQAAGPDQRTHAKHLHKGVDFRDPYPLAEDLLLVARGGELLLMDGRGRTETVYALPKAKVDYWLHEPRPLRGRVREPVAAPQADRSQATGRLVLGDVLHGRSMEGVRPGEIKKLLVLEVLPKPVGFGGVPHAMTWWGTLNFERILGTVPVEPDGSAYLEVPAMRPVFFVALDQNDLSVKRMQSFVSVMPGETLGCAGCHENRTGAPRSPSGANLMAVKREPSVIEPIAGVPELLDFPRDVQPILDRHCLKCHNHRRRDAGVNLSGDHGPIYSHGYWTLFVRGQVIDGQNGLGGRPPRTIGSSASELMKMIDGSHHDAKLSPREVRTVRLWIETGATYAGTYAALSTGSLYGGRIFLDFELGADFARILRARCNACHQDELQLQAKPTWDVHHIRKVRPRDVRFSEHLIYNFSRPERSLALIAPLRRQAGGDGVCKSLDESGKPAVVFRDTGDPDYRKLLALIRTGKRRLDGKRRFDSPGFRPNEHYIREMKRYGVLSAEVGPNDAIDPYATDRAYWRSLWHKPWE